MKYEAAFRHRILIIEDAKDCYEAKLLATARMKVPNSMQDFLYIREIQSTDHYL